MNSIIKRKNAKNLVMLVTCILLFVILIIYIITKPKTLTCTREEVLLEGFKSNENLVVKIKADEIKNIKLTKEINVSDYYDKYGTYYDSLSKVLTSSYDYLGTSYNITKKDHNIIAVVDINKDGIILNNLTIKYNGQDDTTLRYDGVTDLNDETTIKINDEYSKDTLKEKLKDLGYSCK